MRQKFTEAPTIEKLRPVTSAPNADLKALIKMAYVVVTLRAMLESPTVSAEGVQQEAEKRVKNFGGNVGKTEIEEIAFGIKAINIFFTIKEEQGDLEPLEKDVQKIKGVNSAEVTDVRRAIG